MADERPSSPFRFEPSDPTALTTAQVQREVASLKELLEARVEAVEKGIIIAHDDLVRVPTEVQKQVGNLRELHEQKFTEQAALRDEKFASVQKQFDGNKTAVDAALAAVKEAGNKTEAGFTKQIDQLTALFQTGIKAVQGQIDDIKINSSRGEGKGEGSKETKSEQRDNSKYLIAVLGLALAILAFIVGRGGLH